ncbi:MAG: ATP-binding cassette domain-containing protein [Coriobacteriia bacterium]|nr:ATP-binding cassette domain-containing protein [Coriobacteriia bacterium]
MSTLEVKNVSYSYGASGVTKRKTILEQVNLSFSSNERVCLRAPSGFGKTTLCKIMAGYLEPQTGAILLDGQSLYAKRGRASQVPCPVQMIWQHPEQVLDPRLRIERSLAEANALDEGLLDSLGIRSKWLSRYPRELSGGEMQRCCIARALASKPRFLIADEMSTMLDALTQVQIWEALLAYCDANDTGLVFTSHADSLVKRVATNIVDLAVL